MSLIKKTVVLSNHGAEGYVTVVRVGNEVGAKIMGAAFEAGMQMGLRLGYGPTYFNLLQGAKSEFVLTAALERNDEISCVILRENTLVAKAGNGVSEKEVVARFAAKVEDTAPEKTPEPEPQPVPKDPPPKKARTKKEAPKEEGEPSKTEPIVQDVVLSEPQTPETEGASEAEQEEEQDFLKRLQSNNGRDFYINIRDKVEELFVIHEREERLQDAIPGSEWIKIKYDGEDYYVVGVLRDEGKVNYLGYGVPGRKEIKPPKITDHICDWLPVEGLSAYDGYWLIFQDAETGNVSNK